MAVYFDPILGRLRMRDTAAAIGAAPNDATFITQTPSSGLSNEQALSSLATGYMKVTTATGVVSSQAAPIPIADGGSNATSFGTTNGVLYYDGTRFVNDADLKFDGTNLIIGGTVSLSQRASNILALASGDALEVPANVSVGTVINPQALLALSASPDPGTGDVYALFGQVAGTPTANTGNRVFGLSFSGFADTNFNYTNINGGLVGIQMAIQHRGTGTIELAYGAVVSGQATVNGGTINVLDQIYALGYDVSTGENIGEFHSVRGDMPRSSSSGGNPGGIITAADSFYASVRTVSAGAITEQGFYNTNTVGHNAFTDNGQTRYGWRIPAIPSSGAFTSPVTAGGWLAYNNATPTARDTIWWGSGRTAGIGASSATALLLTGAVTGSSSITATTTVTATTNVVGTVSVLTPLLSNNTASLLTVRGFDSIGLGSGQSILFRGGNGSGKLSNGGNMSHQMGALGTSGTIGTIKFYESDGTTEQLGFTENVGVVINEGGLSDIDTRIEGDTDANLFFADASADKIGIGRNNPTQKLGVDGNLALETAGNGLYVKEGSNARMGQATLSGGTVTVNNTSITANTRIFLTPDGGTLTNVGFVWVSARSVGNSFTITSSNVLDTSNVDWLLVEPA